MSYTNLVSRAWLNPINGDTIGVHRKMVLETRSGIGGVAEAASYSTALYTLSLDQINYLGELEKLPGLARRDFLMGMLDLQELVDEVVEDGHMNVKQLSQLRTASEKVDELVQSAPPETWAQPLSVESTMLSTEQVAKIKDAWWVGESGTVITREMTHGEVEDRLMSTALEVAVDDLLALQLEDDGATCDFIELLEIVERLRNLRPKVAEGPDVADIIAGELQTSRAHAYELMRQAIAESGSEDLNWDEAPGHGWWLTTRAGQIVAKVSSSINRSFYAEAPFRTQLGEFTTVQAAQNAAMAAVRRG